MSATVVDITRQTYGLVPSAVIHGINPSDQAWPHVQNCRSHSTTKGVRPGIAAYFKLSRVFDGTSIHTKQPVNTPSHCALRPPLRPSYVSPSPPHLPPLPRHGLRLHSQTGRIRTSRVFMGLADEQRTWAGKPLECCRTGRTIMKPRV